MLFGKAPFPISRDPPEGGTHNFVHDYLPFGWFPISRDPPEGGTVWGSGPTPNLWEGFQFLGIPPKGEPWLTAERNRQRHLKFPISRDPPEGGTCSLLLRRLGWLPPDGSFQFLGIPPKGER